MNDEPASQPKAAKPTSHVIQVMLEERSKLVQEIGRIDRFLAQEGIDIKRIAAGIDVDLTPWGRPRNAMTKTQAIDIALEKADHPLTPREIVTTMQRHGYVFASADPANTLNPYLYGQRKLDHIEKLGRGFVLKTRRAEFEAKQPTASH